MFIDHDITVRHFVLNGVLRALEDEHDVVWIFPERHRRVSGSPADLPIGRCRTVPISETRLHDYRRLYHASVLRMLRGTRDQRAMFAFWRQTLGRRAFWTSWALSWPGTYGLYRRRMLARIGEPKALGALLDEEKPDVIVHPTVLEGLFVSDLVRWGRAHGVPTVFLMNSWDNPAVKAMTVGVPDRFVVWGEQSRQVAHERLGMPLSDIVAFGAAQFEVYRRPPRETAGAYRGRVGVPAGDQLLLYAGSSKGLDETAHLVALEQAVDAGRLPRCTILYRPHPRAPRLGGRLFLAPLAPRHHGAGHGGLLSSSSGGRGVDPPGGLRGDARHAERRRRRRLAAVDHPARGRTARQADPRLPGRRGHDAEHRDVQHGQDRSLPRLLRARRLPAVREPGRARDGLRAAAGDGRAPRSRRAPPPAVRLLRRRRRAVVCRPARRAHS